MKLFILYIMKYALCAFFWIVFFHLEIFFLNFLTRLITQIFYFCFYVFSFSYDEGQTWYSHIFSEQRIRVYGLLTEPGEKTTIFSIFGSAFEVHSWLIVQVNLSSIFRKSFTLIFTNLYLNY